MTISIHRIKNILIGISESTIDQFDCLKDYFINWNFLALILYIEFHEDHNMTMGLDRL